MYNVLVVWEQNSQKVETSLGLVLNPGETTPNLW